MCLRSRLNMPRPKWNKYIISIKITVYETCLKFVFPVNFCTRDTKLSGDIVLYFRNMLQNFFVNQPSSGRKISTRKWKSTKKNCWSKKIFNFAIFGGIFFFNPFQNGRNLANSSKIMSGYQKCPKYQPLKVSALKSKNWMKKVKIWPPPPIGL